MNRCTTKGCHGVTASVFLQGAGWHLVCPVCGRETPQPDKQNPPDACGVESGKGWRLMQQMNYPEAEEHLREARTCTSSRTRANSLMPLLLAAHYGIAFVEEVLYAHIPEKRTSEYALQFCRFPLPEDTDLLDEARELAREEASQDLEYLVDEIRAVHTEAVTHLHERESQFEIFIAWHDQPGQDRCCAFAERLWSGFNANRRYAFVSSKTLHDRVDVRHYEANIYAALSSARAMVIVSDDYASLDQKFLGMEIRRFLQRQRSDDSQIVHLCGLDGAVGALPAGLARLRSLQQHPIHDPENDAEVTLTVRNVCDSINARIEESYQNAVAMIAAGNPVDALPLFESLGDYRDSLSRLFECRELIRRRQEQDIQYQKAVRAEQGKDYAQAADLFQMAGDYLDSAERARRCRDLAEDARRAGLYQQARAAEDAGDDQKAFNLYKNLGDYQDSEDRLFACRERIHSGQQRESRYQSAVEAVRNGDFAEAAALFAGLGDYKDSAQRATQCRSRAEEKANEEKYRKAADAMRRGEREEAIRLFTALGGYRDSAEQAQKCREDSLTADKERKYEEALACMRREDDSSALKLFEALGNYRDSAAKAAMCREAMKDKSLEAKYTEAAAAMKRGSYERALARFEELGDYRDSARKVRECEEKIREARSGRVSAPAAPAAPAVSRKENEYNIAYAAMKNGDYKRAAELFDAMGGFRDSARKAAECRTRLADAEKLRQYNLGLAAEQSRNYIQAQSIYRSLGNYRDCLRRAQFCVQQISTDVNRDRKYDAACACMSAGDFELAAQLFTSLGHYRNSARFADQCLQQARGSDQERRYQQAQAAWRAGKYREAQQIFAVLGTYRDSARMSLECSRKLQPAAAVTPAAVVTHTPGGASGTKVAPPPPVRKKHRWPLVLFVFLLLAGGAGYVYFGTDLLKPAATPAAAVTVSALTLNKGDLVSFGSCEQDNNTKNGREDITWVVASVGDGRALLLSRDVLGFEVFDSLGGTDWDQSSLKRRLAGTTSEMFTARERQILVDASTGSAGSGTLFVPDFDMIRAAFPTASSRKAAPTAYALAGSGAAGSTGSACTWWTSSAVTVSYENKVSTVSSSGNRTSANPDAAGIGVRPAVWIDLNASSLSSILHPVQQ